MPVAIPATIASSSVHIPTAIPVRLHNVYLFCTKYVYSFTRCKITYSQKDESFSVQLKLVTLQSLKACNPSAIPGGITALKGNVSYKNFEENCIGTTF